MDDNNTVLGDLQEPQTEVIDYSSELAHVIVSPRQRALKKFVLAAVGAIPWVGGFLVALIEIRSKGANVDELQRQWLEQHAHKMDRLQGTIASFAARLESFGDEINERLESPEYLALVDKGFRTWDSAATDEKRDYVRRLLANAAATRLCSDDLVRLFLQWINQYDETHFRVIRSIYNRDGITRRQIWLAMHDSIPRDDSTESDVFKLLIHDLTLGHVIRQQRATTDGGQFLKRQASTKSKGSTTMKSPFSDVEGYELTEVGRSFVHYVMDEVAPQLGYRSVKGE